MMRGIFVVVWLFLTTLSWAVPPELEWLAKQPGLHKTEIRDYGSYGWEGTFDVSGDGYATMEKIRGWMHQQGWKVKDQDASAGGVTSRRLDGVRGREKFNVTATQQRGQTGKIRAALIGRPQK
ncbi:MAG: hypothetical protein U0931_38230 [Vulcanimicrobiota bacterium]